MHEGTRAAESGLQVGDQVVSVNGHDFVGLTHREAVRTLHEATHIVMAVKFNPLGLLDCARPASPRTARKKRASVGIDTTPPPAASPDKWVSCFSLSFSLHVCLCVRVRLFALFFFSLSLYVCLSVRVGLFALFCSLSLSRTHTHSHTHNFLSANLLRRSKRTMSVGSKSKISSIGRAGVRFVAHTHVNIHTQTQTQYTLSLSLSLTLLPRAP